MAKKKIPMIIGGIAGGIVIVAAVLFLIHVSGKEPPHSGDNDAAGAVFQKMSEDELRIRMDKWARAFVERDGQILAAMITPELCEEMFEGEEDYSFGWSSPWPVDDGYQIMKVDADNRKAEILYYAWTSDPHITVWRESISYNWEDYQVMEESVTDYSAIASAQEYREAYPDGINETWMDYQTNGLGEALNENAKQAWYGDDLYEPVGAAVRLLNLINNESIVQVEVVKEQYSGDMVTVRITFPKDEEEIQTHMIRPWGEDGIWIPQD